MNTQDSPNPEECRRILNNEKRRFMPSVHTHQFTQLIEGQVRNWWRCRCGEWSEE